MKLLYYLFIIYIFVLQFTGIDSANCTTISSCNSCIDNNGCSWCSVEGICVPSSISCESEKSTSCIAPSSENIFTIIFICVLSGLILVCCCACYYRKFYDADDGPRTPILPSIARGLIFRNSLQGDGLKEWMCVICGFDNHPRVKDCVMCGTPHEFSIRYKSDKKEVKLIKNTINEAKKQKFGPATPLKKQLISIPEEANIITSQVTDVTRSSISRRDSIRQSLISADVSNYRESFVLSQEKKLEAMNYRRLNQLSLRQKSARRRKIWQRVYDRELRELKWVRVDIKEVKVGNAPFGYTPGNSMSYDPGASMDYRGSMRGSFMDPTASLLSAAAAGLAGETTRDSFTPGIFNYGSSVHRKRASSRDSFGDSVVMTKSPGYTSVIDKDGNLTWKIVDSVPSPSPNNAKTPEKQKFITPIKKSAALSTDTSNPLLSPLMNESHLGENQNVAISVDNSSPYMSADDEAFELFMSDLESVASLTYKEKLLWFLDRMGELQKPWSEGCVRMEVRRNKILEDSVTFFGSVPATELHKWIRIQFFNEPGIDAGGLEREWFGLVVKELFSPEQGLFICSSGESSGGSYHINPTSSLMNSRHLECFTFAGRLMGKAIMEQQPISCTLSLPLRKQILTTPIMFSDLEFVDVDLYKNLLYLYDSKKNGMDVADLDLDFSVAYNNFGKQLICELKPGGQNIPVTESNKEEYLQLRLRHRMFDSIRPQLEALLKGIYDVIPADLLSIFDYQEFDILLCGAPDIDFNDWYAHTEYMGEYHRVGNKHKVIKWFWKAVEQMSNEERIRLLQFVTGNARLPAQGFKALQSNDGNYRKFNLQSISKKVSIPGIINSE